MTEIDWNGPISEDDDYTVDIPEIDNPLLEEFEEFQTIVSPIAPTDNFGVDVFMTVFEDVCDIIVAKS